MSVSMATSCRLAGWDNKMSDNYSDYSHSDNEEDDEDFDEKAERELQRKDFPKYKM